MFNMEASVQASDACVESEDQTPLAVTMGFAMRNGCEESQQESTSKTRERVDAYIKHRSVAKAAKECGITEDRMSEILTKERNRRGLSDIRYLYADTESGFNVGGNSTGEDVTAKELLALAELQSFCCALSGIAITPESSALDHIIPVASGGTHEVSNLQWVDKRINTMKGELPVDEFVELCRLVAANADR